MEEMCKSHKIKFLFYFIYFPQSWRIPTFSAYIFE